jgi:hypothetical protein
VPEFVPALELNAAFYADVIGPLLGDIPHAAARLGGGSEVLGFDTARSTDHDWGPTAQIFTPAVAAARRAIDGRLPAEFRGWPTTFGSDQVVPQTHITVEALGDFLAGQLALDPRAGMSTVDWLAIPQQRLLGLTRGAVYADPDGELAAVRKQLAYFPDQVWLWLIACQWQRIAQVEAFVGRTNEVGDILGSRILAGNIVRELMRLAFLLDRTYWPYQKWFGSAFSQLQVADELGPILQQVLAADHYPEREQALVRAYEFLANRHNRADISEPVDPTTRTYFDRPFLVLMSERFVTATKKRITDPELADRPLYGSIDQFADSTDIASSPQRSARLKPLYQS